MITFLTETPLGEAPGWGMALQAIYDLVPVCLFLAGGVIMLRCFYNKMVKGAYALLASGSVMIFAAGVLKAMHKFLLGIASIDYVILDKQFTSTQSLGFLLIFLALVGMFTKHNKNYTKVRAISLPLFLAAAFAEVKVYESSLPFIVIMVIGATGMLVMLTYMAFRMQKPGAAVLFIISILAMVSMGYLSTKRYYEWAWIQISVNIIYQGGFLLGMMMLKSAGLGDEDAFLRESKEAEAIK